MHRSFAGGVYLGQQLPGSKPLVFAVGKVSTEHEERDAAVSPDGKAFCYTIVGPSRAAIMEVKLIDERWTRPEVAPFSGSYSDLEPSFSPDGQRLYFSSRRPRQGTSAADYDIWFVERTDSSWSQPLNLGPDINSSADEFYPSVSANGNLYFTAARPEGLGAEDLYRSRLIEGRYTTPENLGPGVNSVNYEFNAFVAPDERFLIFSSAGRNDDIGGGDLYVSYCDSLGVFGPAISLGPSVNSPRLDYSPHVTPDGEYLFFSSRRVAAGAEVTATLTYETLLHQLGSTENGRGDIYWMKAAIIDSLRQD